MKLVKLVYIAHGWHLGLTGEPLLTEPIQAWKYGPVLESIYHTFKVYGNSPIPISAQVQWAALRDPARIAPFLDRVWEAYGKYTGGQLSTITHQPDTPWSKVYKEGHAGLIIPDEVIREHYKAKADARRTEPAKS